MFRFLFCLIFVGLGGEHILDDTLIQRLMPEWVPYKRLVSFLCGLWLAGWGMLILIGWRVNWAAVALGAFLVTVTAAVHVPGLFIFPNSLPRDHYWMWDILQRTNLVKNLCLLGVCFHLLNHELGRYSLEHYLAQKKDPGSRKGDRENG